MHIDVSNIHVYMRLYIYILYYITYLVYILYEYLMPISCVYPKF